MHPRGCGFTMETETHVGPTGGGRSRKGGFYGSRLWLWDRYRRRQFCSPRQGLYLLREVTGKVTCLAPGRARWRGLMKGTKV